ncbi:YraN family protein [Pseudooceanicola sp. C21-150M6]|uniref:YraN family protein n=1 Tax=Pseudooceanicola sp. C21-150M6 TaxID=3434355 RepID=UPI003D7F5904
MTGLRADPGDANCKSMARCDLEPIRPSEGRRHRGRVNDLAGRAGEDAALRAYADLGYRPVTRRWRGPAGEIDLIFKTESGAVLFVEVKSGATHDRAAERISTRQVRRIFRSAEAYVAKEPKGSLTPFRIDACLVDATGVVKIMENAFAGFF